VDIETRSAERIRYHYDIERALALKLREAPKAARGALYSALYDELFRQVPDHPQLRRQASREQSSLEVRRKMALVGRYLDRATRYLEVGPGDCAFAFAAAGRVREATAVDVSAEIARQPEQPQNFKLVISDGCSIPVPPGTITVAYSNQLMEHLHPDDAEEQLRNIHLALAPGGAYVCITPNRISGPHDVSVHFDHVATGFHLREYTYGELVALFRRVGFKRFRGYFGGRGFYLRTPLLVLRAAEVAVGTLPAWLRKIVARSAPGRALLGINFVAFK
jgi:SAM-dependent methyltransferase